MASKSLVIVESPTKAKTIKKFLPKGFIVEASMGHVRDLPQTAADVPAKFKKEEWARTGVNVEKDFEPIYVTIKGKSKIIQGLKKHLKEATDLYLATDEDREGESISWHLVELLKPKIPTKRMVFHEITRSAIEKSLKNSREIDQRLVQAQETRRILDRLYGFTLSPLIWKKVSYGLSAGRVQSVGLRLLVNREKERLKFKKAIYWDLKSELEKSGHAPFEAKLNSYKDQKVASGKDFGNDTGQLRSDSKVYWLKEEEAKKLVSEIKSKPWKVISVEEKTTTSRPAPPFITSTLQQEGNKKLGLSARETMRVAQSLYEQGLITYMRTDSPNLSKEAIEGTRRSVEDLFGKSFLSEKPRQYSSKSKGAQEAHEAIRPAGENPIHPKQAGLSGKPAQLYELIWKRTMATQMADAKKLSVSARIEVGPALFSATGTRVEFPGFLKVYSIDEDSLKESILPPLKEGDTLNPKSVEALIHETKPIARFTEASIVQRLEKEGVGRPSTYAAIIGTILERKYATKVGNALVPSLTGFAVVSLLEEYFPSLVDYQFTSNMEEALDEIAAGEMEWLPYLKGFYGGKTGIRHKVDSTEKKIDAKEARKIKLFDLDGIDILVGRFGAYLVKINKDGEEVRASIPEDIAPADLTKDLLEEIIARAEKGPEPIGTHPDTGENIYCFLGRYGPYLQLGEEKIEEPEEVIETEEPTKGKKKRKSKKAKKPKVIKPRRASVPKEIDYRTIHIDDALKILSLPRVLGNHPETGEPITANRGRFGPYVVHQDDFRSLKKDDDVYEVDLKRALEIFSEEKKRRRGSKVLKEFDPHPKTKKKISLLEGMYGPYLKYGSKNVSLPKELEDPAKLSLEKVVEIIDQKSK